jgi:hypothetical protein
LKYKNSTLDITFPDSKTFAFNANLEEETPITPQQIGSFKVDRHQTFIKNWLKDRPDLTFDFIWQVREQLIQKLSDQHPQVDTKK